jgi:hypothetical protein
MPEPPSSDVQITVELAVPLQSFAIGHVHVGDFDRNVALGSQHPFAIDVRSRAHEDAQERHGVLELGKYLGEPLPVTKMNIPCILDQQVLTQHRVT